ncbi:MAG: plasmid pRiA4b ORF-3 family protein [Actinomycetota bacterium]|nr:plasmid pRiA4b ORF-3 family protein [Actinomycetota bacterium]
MDVEPVDIGCGCGTTHPGAPADTTGCGVSFRVELEPVPDSDAAGRDSQWPTVDRSTGPANRAAHPARAAWPNATPSPPGPGNPSLPAVRASAEAWRSGLTAFLTLVTTEVIIKGRDTTAGLPTSWRVLVTVLIGGGLALAVAGLWRVLAAQAGTRYRLTLHVPGRFTLASLHDVIQVAMGWEDDHLHGFEIDRVRYGPPRSGTPSPFRTTERDERKARLAGSCTRSRLFSATPTTSATHGTTSSRWRTSPSPTLTPGARCAWRASGPARQNCGGVPGHYHLLDVMDDPDHGDDEHLTEWLSARFDPERVDCDAVNRRLAQLSVTPSLLSAADPRDGTLRQASMWLTSAGCTQRQASM